MPAKLSATTMIDPREISADLSALCRDIGERLAGSPAERRAAGHVTARLRAAGLERVTSQEFPCIHLRHARAEVQVPDRRTWRSLPALPIVGAPPTPGGAAVEGELVWLSLPEAQHRLRPGSLRGAIAAVFGPMPTSPAAHRKLLAAAPSAVVHIDERFPFPWAKSDGSYPYWNQRYGMLPTVSVPYTEAWNWRRNGVERLRVAVDVTLRQENSLNVVGELPGSDPTLPAIAFTSHLDTQLGNCGADDNAAGVASVLALARLLAVKPHRRTLRFIAFGAEEQLSVGATDYVRRHRIGPGNIGLVLNFDSLASPLGHYVLWTGGDARLARHAVRRLATGGIDARVQHEISPFCDCFPFNRAGIPTIWIRRQNFSGGRWQHHSQHDNLDNLSVPQLAALLGAVAPWAADLAGRIRWPFAARLAPAQHASARRISRALLGW